MSTFTQSGASVKTWLIERMPHGVALAVERLARSDDVRHIAVMPDVHLASEVCVGTVLATTHLIYPSAVGGDIGCGMAAIAFDCDADLLRDGVNAGKVLTELPRVVPAMRHASRDRAPTPGDELQSQPLSDPRLESIRRRDGAIQLGTLGRGNHFLEFQYDDEARLWLMVHSGSRTIGPAVRDWHLARAEDSASRLPFLDAQSPQGQAYLTDAAWARRYAAENRRAMVNAAVALIASLFSVRAVNDSLFDCDHNHVRRETHFGEDMWIHRKGATPARAGERGIIAGSMGTESYHVEGRGFPDSLCSSSHGAGRAMSRDEARRRISPREVSRQLSEVWFDPRRTQALRDEAPSAYKDVRNVMRAQKELTRIVRRLRPVLCYKAE